jgi:DNA-binding LytR/AlgR family response regulator
MNVIAIDDEPYALKIITDDISKIKGLSLLGAFSHTNIPMELIERTHLIFLDIQMPTITGIQFLRNLDKPPMVIFTTAFEQYAMEGFELNVVDYLLKPIPFERLEIAVSRAFELHNLRAASVQNHFTVFAEYKQIKIFTSQVRYIEGMKDYVKIFLVNEPKPIITRLNMKGVLEKLPSAEFSRVHNSFIINNIYISSFQKQKLFIGEKEIPVSIKFVENIIQLL